MAWSSPDVPVKSSATTLWLEGGKSARAEAVWGLFWNSRQEMVVFGQHWNYSRGGEKEIGQKRFRGRIIWTW